MMTAADGLGPIYWIRIKLNSSYRTRVINSIPAWKSNHMPSKMRWNYFSIPKLQRHSRWSLEWISNFIALNNGCNYLTMLGLKFTHASVTSNHGSRMILAPVRFLARKAEWSARRNFTPVLFSWSHQTTGPVRLDTIAHLSLGRIIRRTPHGPRTTPVMASHGPRTGN